jgi:uncharacterized protein (DUF58 family)
VTARPLLTSAAIASVDDLELAARLIVEGTRSGGHRSPFHGFTAEFSQHRPYRPGDDLKHLDWKLLARTDRLYTRRFSETTNLAAIVVVDTSGSMDFPESPGEQVTKFRYAVLMAAALAYLIIDQGDAAGLVTMSGGDLVYLPPKGGRAHLGALLARLSRLEPGSVWQMDTALSRGAGLLRKPGVLLVVSDLYDATDQTFRELRRLGRGGHDVGVMQIVTREELSFPYSADVLFEDLETGERRHLDAGAAAPAYQAAVALFLNQCREDLLRDGHDYALMPTDIAPARALRSYLLRRAAATPALRQASRP